jgi:hypothetical protein
MVHSAAVVKIASLVLITAAVIGAGVVVYAPRHASTQTVVPVATSPIVPVIAGTTTKPAGATTAPVGVTQETGKRTAEAFFTALRDRDAATLSKLILADTPQAQRAAADRYITQFRDRAYARFPQRLGGIARSVAVPDRSGRLSLMGVDAPTPTDAQIEHLSLVLKSTNGQWRVSKAVLSSGNTLMRPEHELVRLPTTGPLPPGNWKESLARYNDASAAIMGILRWGENPSPQNFAKLAALLERAPQDLQRLAEALRGTDLAISQASQTRLSDWFHRAHGVAVRSGPEGLKAEINNVSGPTKQDLVRLIDLGDQLAKRVDAQTAAAATRGSRPPAFGPSIHLTMAWDGTHYELPSPVIAPEWIGGSAQSKVWHEGPSTTTDDAGNIYEIYRVGDVRDASGKLHHPVSSVRQYRSDGTLAAFADFDSRESAVEWATLDATGTRYIVRVSRSPNALRVILFGRQGNERKWEVRDGVVRKEQVCDPIGGDEKTTHWLPPMPKSSAQK